MKAIFFSVIIHALQQQAENSSVNSLVIPPECIECIQSYSSSWRPATEGFVVPSHAQNNKKWQSVLQHFHSKAEA